MDVTLPNGKVITDVPGDATREDIMERAIAGGMATPEDFAQPESRNEDFQPKPSQMPERDRGILGSVQDFLVGKPGQRNVFTAPELNEMSMRAFKSGLGGLLTGDPKELQQIIAENYPEAEFGEIQGQPAVRLPSGDYPLNPEGIDPLDALRFGVDVAAFTPAGRVTGAGLGALGKGALVAGGTQTGLQGIEAATGGTFDPEDVAIEAATQGIFQVGEAGVKAFRASPLAQKIKDRFRGGSEAEPYEAVSEVFKSRKPEKVIPEVMADPDILKAANDLGINVNPGVYSTNRIYQEMENALKAIPQSKLSANEKETLDALARQADQLLVDFAGTTDKSALSQDVKQRMVDTIRQLETEADVAYNQIKEVIPQTLKIRPSNTLDYIEDLIDKYGTVDDLSAPIRSLYKRLKDSPEGVNYALIDQRRKDIGNAAFKNQGPFKDASANELKQLYNTMSDDAFKAAEFFDLGDQVQAAKAMVSRRKDLEEAAVSVLGKDLSKDIMPQVGAGVRGLAKGQMQKFDQVMSSIPEDMRPQVAIAALNDILAGGSTRSKGFSLSGFTSTYEALQRNKSASKKLFDLVPKEAQERLDNIYQVSRGLIRLNQKDLANPSGTARQVLGAMDAPGGVLDKLFRYGGRGAAGAAATAPFDAGVVGAVGGIVSAVRSGTTKASQAADEMLTSPAFREAMQRFIDGNPVAANSVLSKVKATKNWIANQPPEVKRSIARQGLIQYLTDTEQAQTDDTNPNE